MAPLILTPSEFRVAGHAVDVRDGDPARDAVEGVVPAVVVTPHTASALAASLAWASQRGARVLIEGAGTKRAWGRRPRDVDVAISMRRLTRVLVHRQGDLTVTVEAGLPLRELNDHLAAHGQQLPLDPPFADGATIGGLLATNDSGPARHRFGTPRDLVIGVQVATADGQIANAGGQVVKNVAGYDLSKLVCGSFGALAVIVSATFKLLPLPAASRTVVLDAPGADALGRVIDTVSASQLEPVAFECHVRRGASTEWTRCLIRFASVAAAVEAQVEETVRRVDAPGVSLAMLSGEAETDYWKRYGMTAAASNEEAAVRLSWLPSQLVQVLGLLQELSATIDVELCGRTALGAGVLRLRGDVPEQAAAIERLRHSTTVGNVVVTSGSIGLKDLVDVWGPRPNPDLLDSIKRALDPNGTLGAGRAV